jgi:predicted CxxxxCH...CXXCH cytochrome family protein
MRLNYMNEYINRRFKMKLRGALLLVVAATACALSGLMTPQIASASVDIVTSWPAKPVIVSDTAASTVTGKFTPGLGNNRLMLVSVAYESTAAPTGFTIQYGGQNVTQIVSNTTGTNKLWLGYLNENGIIAAGTNKTLSVTLTGAGTITATYATCAVFVGVDQGTPISGSNSLGTTAAALTIGPVAFTSGNASSIAGNNGLSVYIANWNNTVGQTSASTGYTEVRDYLGTNLSLSGSYKVTTGASAESVTSTSTTSAIAALAGVGLNPATKIATNSTCGDCHGNPPNDASSRNVPPGQFLGSHEKHTGNGSSQYAYVCTQCHYNAVGYNHSTGYKNITGSSVPGNAYSAGKKILDTNAPAFGSCSKIYCHSNGRGTGMGTKQYSSAKWGGGAKTCLSCHGGRNGGGAPARSVGNFTLSTTHSQHLKYPAANMNCQICHSDTATNATTLKNYSGIQHHANGTRDVTFTNVAYGTYTSYKSTEVGSAGNARTCNNVSCHGGKSRGSWSATTINNDNTCVHCHGTAGTSAALANTAANRKYFAPGWNKTGTSTDQTASSNDYRVGSHFKHLSSLYMKTIKCNECHTVPDQPFTGTHMATQRYNSQTLTFSQASTATITIGVASTATPTRLASFAGYTSGTATKAATCSSVYCHGNRLKTGDTASPGAVKKPYWNYSAMVNYSDPANACSRCHGNPPSTGTAATTHNGKAATFSCSGCHSGTVDAQGNIKKGGGLHINGKVEATGGHEWSFGGLRHKPLSLGGTGSITANAVYPYTNCNGCHTTATGGTYPPSARNDATLVVCTTCHINSTNFQGATPGCWDCHGSGATLANAAPAGNAFPNISGSHSAHIAFAYACADCHVGGGSGTAVHGNYSSKPVKTKADVVVKLNTATAGLAATYSGSASMTCGTSVCHGQKSPQWGQVVPAQKCLRCHGSQTLSYTGYTQATIAPGTGNIDTNRVTGTTGTPTPRGGMHQEHLKVSIVTPNRISCNACHTVPSAVNHAKLDNRTTATITFSGLAIANSHGTASVTRVGGLITCNNTYCHTATTNTGLAMAPVWNNNSYLTGTGGTAPLVLADCTRCHALPPPASGSHGGIPSVASFPIGSANCGGNCHSLNLTTGTTYATIFGDATKHMNGAIEGGNCVGCHANEQSAGVVTRKAVVGDFASQSHHVQGIETLDGKACYQCHGEANADGTINTTYHKAGGTGGSGSGVVLAVWGTSRATATYIVYTANGKRNQIAKLNDVCMGCHNTPNQAVAPFGKYSTHRYSPEARLATPKAKTSIQSRYSSTRKVAWSNYLFNNNSGHLVKYGTNMKNKVTKALSAHGNAINNQFPNWSTAKKRGGDDEYKRYDVAASSTLGTNRNVMCYDCHNSHGSDASGITSSYSSATGRNKGGLLKSTVAGRSGYNVTYKPASRSITYSNFSGLGQASALTTVATVNAGASICNDCHNNDTRKVNINKPWSITTTYSSTRAIVGYWSTPYFDNYTVYSALRSVYKQGGAVGASNDRRKPMGGHFGSSVSGRSAAHSSDINGLCTPCHDPHGVSNALGSDKDHGVPLLKGTWLTSPYLEDKAGARAYRGGGNKFAGIPNGGAVPGYHIDQNTFMTTPTPNNGGATNVAGAQSNMRRQQFRSFSILSSAYKNVSSAYPGSKPKPSNFAGLCMECHSQLVLTGSATNTTSKQWLSKERVHQTVAGWASTNGTNVSNKVHAYTCAKCHAPHVSRLPRLLVTNCLDQRHFGMNVSTSIASTGASTTTPGNIIQSTLTTSAMGAGRFPGGGKNYYLSTSKAPLRPRNPGGWWFQRDQPGAAGYAAVPKDYGSACHNATNAGGTTYSPANQKWNNKSIW